MDWKAGAADVQETGWKAVKNRRVIQSEVSQKEKNKYRMLTQIYGT